MNLRRSAWAGILVLSAILSINLLLACRKSPAGPPPPTPESAKQASDDKEFADSDKWLVENFDRALGELEAINSSSNSDSWDEVEGHYEVFRQATRVLPQPELSHPYISLALLDLFDLYNLQLQRSISEKDSEQVSFASNQLTNILSDFIAQIQAENAMEVRRELRRIIYLYREMEYWSERDDEAMLKVRTTRLQNAWVDLRPVIFDHNGAKAAEQFDEVMSRLERIDTVDEYIELSPDLSDAVNSITEVFDGNSK